MKISYSTLRKIAEAVIAPDHDPEEAYDDICNAIHPECEKLAQALIDQDGIPDDNCGWDLEGREILLCQPDEGRYIPSVSSDYWEAKASSVDPELAFDDPVEALASGLADLFTHELVADLVPDEDEE